MTRDRSQTVRLTIRKRGHFFRLERRSVRRNRCFSFSISQNTFFDIWDKFGIIFFATIRSPLPNPFSNHERATIMSYFKYLSTFCHTVVLSSDSGFADERVMFAEYGKLFSEMLISAFDPCAPEKLTASLRARSMIFPSGNEAHQTIINRLREHGLLECFNNFCYAIMAKKFFLGLRRDNRKAFLGSLSDAKFILLEYNWKKIMRQAC